LPRLAAVFFEAPLFLWFPAGGFVLPAFPSFRGVRPLKTAAEAVFLPAVLEGGFAGRPHDPAARPLPGDPLLKAGGLEHPFVSYRGAATGSGLW